MSTSADPTPETTSSPAGSSSRRWWIFGVVSAVIFVGLAASIAHLLSQPYLPPRYLDVEGTRLLTDESGKTILVVGLRDVARPEAIAHRVRDDHPDIDGVVVEIRTRATTGAQRADAKEVYYLRVPLERVDRVTLLDLRWARVEGLEVVREEDR